MNSQNLKVTMVRCVWVCEGRARAKRRFFFNVHIRIKHIIIIIIIIIITSFVVEIGTGIAQT